MRRHALSIFQAATCIWIQTADAQSPSFDCSKARYPDEVAICRNPRLAELDECRSAAYAYLKSTRGRAFADEIGIPFWRLRQACQYDVACIRQRQIEAINSYQAAGAPIPILRQSAPQQAFGGNAEAAAPFLTLLPNCTMPELERGRRQDRPLLQCHHRFAKCSGPRDRTQHTGSRIS